LPDDLDLEAGVLRVSNKPRLHWQVKTRNEREIPLVPVLADVLRYVISRRTAGPVFLRRRFSHGAQPMLAGKSQLQLENQLLQRMATAAAPSSTASTRAADSHLARGIWRDAGIIKTERIRIEFMRLTRTLGIPEITAPKSLRHGFATCLQDANVDPLVRCELMGHSTGARSSGHHLGMTATYTHTRWGTMKTELARALAIGAPHGAAQRWLQAKLQSLIPSNF